MNTKIILSLAAAASVLFSGCVGTGPNTQRGAVGGAALGAAIGGIVGNNSRSHNTVAGMLLGGAAGAIAGGTLGNAADQQAGTIYQSEAEATTNVVLAQPPAPPAPPIEVITVQPAPAAIWVGGYWVYARSGYGWVPGHWQMPPPRCRVFVAPHWQHRRGGYVYIRGYWH